LLPSVQVFLNWLSHGVQVVIFERCSE